MALPYGRTDQDVTPVLRLGDALIRDNETLLQDAGRTGDLEKYTVLSRNPTTRKLVPLTNVAATDGTEIPVGLSAQSADEADIIAGDITGFQLYIKTGRIDEDSIVLENSLTLDSVITSEKRTIRDLLHTIDIYPEPGFDMDRPENT
jgi:hypothetical protein